jgi:ABC-2 type transport system ATP-binding protein
MLSLQNVTKLYGTVIGVNDVSAELDQGAHGLLGPNGAGKTTLLGLITGQLRLTIGSVQVFGEAPFGNRRILARIGYCPAADITERNATPQEWVTYLMRLSGFDTAEAPRRAARALEEVGLGEACIRPLSTLSKGMRQRAKLAGAFAHEPDLLVLDEPFDGLDPIARHDLVNLVRTWAQTRSLLVASHLLHEVEALRADLAVILGGRLVANGSATEIRKLVDALPTKIKFKTPSVNNLAQTACAAGVVETLHIPDINTVVIGTRQVSQLTDVIAKAVHDGLVVSEVIAEDRTLEGIFSRLVKLHRGVEQ